MPSMALCCSKDNPYMCNLARIDAQSLLILRDSDACVAADIQCFAEPCGDQEGMCNFTRCHQTFHIIK